MWVYDHWSTGFSASSRALCHRILTGTSIWARDHWSIGFSASSRELCHRILTRPSSVCSWSVEHRFLSFFKSALPQNSNKAFKCELMITGVQQIEESFSIARTSFRAWFNVSWGLGQENCLEQRKLGQCQSGDNNNFLNLWADILTYLSKDVFIWRRRWRRYRAVLLYPWFRRRRQPQKFRSLPSQFQARVRPHSGRLPRILLHHPRKRAASSTLDTTAARKRQLLRRTVILFCPTFFFLSLWFPKPLLIILLCLFLVLSNTQ